MDKQQQDELQRLINWHRRIGLDVIPFNVVETTENTDKQDSWTLSQNPQEDITK